jgi:hypothetical protein
MIDIFLDSLWITIPGFIVILFGCIPRYFNPDYERSVVVSDIKFILIWNVLFLLSLMAAHVFGLIKVVVVWVLFIMFCRKIID